MLTEAKKAGTPAHQGAVSKAVDRLAPYLTLAGAGLGAPQPTDGSTEGTSLGAIQELRKRQAQ